MLLQCAFLQDLSRDDGSTHRLPTKMLQMTTVRHYMPHGDHRDDPSSASAQRERNRTVSSFYNQTAIDDTIDLPSIRISADTMMYTNVSNGKNLEKKLIVSNTTHAPPLHK